MVLSAVQDTIGFLGAGLLRTCWQPQPGGKRDSEGGRPELSPPAVPGCLYLFDPLKMLKCWRNSVTCPAERVIWSSGTTVYLTPIAAHAITGAHPRQVVYVGLIHVFGSIWTMCENRGLGFKVVGCRQTSGKHGADVRKHCSYRFSDLGRDMMLLD